MNLVALMGRYFRKGVIFIWVVTIKSTNDGREIGISLLIAPAPIAPVSARGREVCPVPILGAIGAGASSRSSELVWSRD